MTSTTNKIIIASVIVILAIGAVSAAAFYTVNNQLSTVLGQLSALNSQISSMSGQINSLNNTLTGLTNAQTEIMNIIQTLIDSTYPMTITDAAGRAITLYSAPERIVSGAPSVTEILFALNLSQQVVGVDSYSDYPPELLSLEATGAIQVVGGVSTLDVEKVAALAPDLVIIDYGMQGQFIDTLSDLGLTVIALKSDSILVVEQNILLLGKINDRSSEAVAIVGEIESTVQSITASLEGVNDTRVLELMWLDPMYTTGSGTYLNEIIEIAGGTNIMADKSGWGVTNPEEILLKNPDVVIFDTMYLSMTYSEVFGTFTALEGFENVNAIINGDVYVLTNQSANLVERAGPRIVDAIKLMACILHPDIFNVTIPTLLGDDYPNYIR
jgi:iron complex transport system substrate-binding protein